MRSRTIATVSGATLAIAAGGYAAADAADVVPGWITDAPVPPVPAPFPSPALASAVPEDADAPAAIFDDTAPLPDAAAVQSFSERLVNDARSGTSVGVQVVDVVTGSVLAGVNADVPQVPASNAKILTATGVLLGLGGDHRLETTVMWDGPAHEGVPLISLVAGGDMMLAADAGHGDIARGANGYAGLGDLADAVATGLAEQGVDTVSLAMVDAHFAGPPIHPQWPASATANGYIAPVTGMAVNVGKQYPDEYPPRWPDPSMNAAEVFAARLAERGITVTRVFEAATPVGSQPLATVRSAPLIEILDHVLTYSDNTIAEVVLMVLALDRGERGTTVNGAAAAIALCREAGLTLDGVILDDGSGFSRRSRLTAASVTEIVVFLASNPEYANLARRLPLSASEGTLAERLMDPAAAGWVRAKTGTLGGVSALGGTVVTADGRLLAFSVLADETSWNSTSPRAAIDDFVTAVARCGCS